MIPCQRALFDIPEDVAYLNCAYMGPLPIASLAAGEAGLRLKARPWRLTSAHFFEDAEEARLLFAPLVGAEAEGVALVPSASYGLAAAARNLRLGDGRRVVTLADQFPSNVYVWRAMAAEQGGEVTSVALDPLDDATEAVLAAIDERCAIAALPQVLWTTGQKLDLARIGARCREVGAALVLDLTQSAGAMRIDFAAVQPDFAVAAAYKWLLAPYATGFLHVAPKHRDGRPLEEGWVTREGAEDFTRLIDYREAQQPGARRFDMGERSNFALIPALNASLRQIAAWGVGAIEATLFAMNARIAARARAAGLTTPSDESRGPHFLSLALPEDAPRDLTARLAARGVHLSQRGSSLRITPHLWASEADIDRLFDALEAEL